jgi:hypothetical protein
MTDRPSLSDVLHATFYLQPKDALFKLVGCFRIWVLVPDEILAVVYAYG